MSRPDQITIDQAAIDDAMDDAEEVLSDRLLLVERISRLPSTLRAQVLDEG